MALREISGDAIADAAHLGFKEEIVCETMRRSSKKAIWIQLGANHPHDARAQLNAWVEIRARCLTGLGSGMRTVELKGEGHHAYALIERHKAQQRDRLIAL
jgi:hypothetical protein